MDRTRRMNESQEQGGVAWERETAWRMIAAAMDAGDSDALALGWSRYSDAMANGALSAAGAVLIPLDRRIQHLTDLFEKARTADLDWRADERARRDQQADRVYQELDRLAVAAEDTARRLGGLSEKVEAHEVRIVALETQGMPAGAVSEIHILRSEVEHIRSLLILTRRQLWLTWIPIATFVVLVVISIIVRGWQ